MATLDANCLFPAGMDDLMDDPILCCPHFLQFLGESDLTGPLPTIPDAPVAEDQMVKPPTSPEVTSSVTAAVLQPAVTTAAPMVCVQPQQPEAVQVHFASGSLLQPQQLSQLQPLLPVPFQKPQPEPSRAASCSSSDASGGRMFAGSMPGSPVSSPAPTSSSDISSLPPARHAPRNIVAGELIAKRQRLQHQGSSFAAAAAAFLPQPQQQQPSSSSPPSSSQQEKPLTKQQIAANKRRAPEIDWRSIEDPAERRRQRRLAKNRVTAARSRERKKEQLAGMEDRMDTLEQENEQMRALLASLSQENASLREQLASLTRGAAACLNTTGSGPEPAVLECVAIMHLVACLVLSVRAAFGLALEVLVAGLAQQQTRMDSLSVSSVSLCATSSSPAGVSSVGGCLQRLHDSSSGGLLQPRLRSAVVDVAVAAAA
ncbi:hypothetical protein COO60DRAFT_1503989 [Scenedesmus sp. NREL 46B-D3]|nr:hypothetical protein COO60DRAFT_1503989 [Scenedesmus sp. NREL 46B-D3]